MADAAEKLMTVAEFLARDDGTDTRYELVAGRRVAMERPRATHSIIVANLAGATVERPWYGGLNASVLGPGRSHTFYQADLVISCTPVRAGMATIPEPAVIFEVLSPSSIEHDRGRKVYDYRQIESVQEIVLVSSEQRHVMTWRRQGAKWEVEDLIGDAVLELEAVGIAIPLAAIYADSGI